MKLIKILSLTTIFFLLGFLPVFAQDGFEKAIVNRVIEEQKLQLNNDSSFYQKLEVEIISNGHKEVVEQGKVSVSLESNKLKTGDKIIVYKSENNDAYQIADRWRLDSLTYIFIIFIILVLIIVGFRGLLALGGLLYSLFILLVVMVPMLLHGYNPVTTTLLTGILIVLPSMYLTHGFNRNSSLAGVSILGGLLVALIINYWWTHWATLNGIGSEEVYYLQIAGMGQVDFMALFIGGVIIGVLGVLDDVALGQINVVGELREVDNRLSHSELLFRSLRVGKGHVLSLVNTLAFAYVGTSLPLFMLFVGDQNMPWWVLLNSEGVGEEIIRTLVGSAALVLTVPIATFLAVYFGNNTTSGHAHKH